MWMLETWKQAQEISCAICYNRKSAPSAPDHAQSAPHCVLLGIFRTSPRSSLFVFQMNASCHFIFVILRRAYFTRLLESLNASEKGNWSSSMHSVFLFAENRDISIDSVFQITPATGFVETVLAWSSRTLLFTSLMRSLSTGISFVFQNIGPGIGYLIGAFTSNLYVDFDRVSAGTVWSSWIEKDFQQSTKNYVFVRIKLLAVYTQSVTKSCGL